MVLKGSQRNTIFVGILYQTQIQLIRKHDLTGNGYIPTSSLREILAALDDQLTSDQLNEMIAEIDSDSSGTVDFEGKHYIHDEY